MPHTSRARSVPFDKIGKRESSPWNHHGPTFDTPVTVDTILYPRRLHDIVEIVCRRFLDLPFDSNRPRFRAEADGVFRGVAFVYPKFIEVVIGRDVIELVHFVINIERSLFPLRPAILTDKELRKHYGRRKPDSGSGCNTDKRPAIQEDVFRSNFGWMDLVGWFCVHR